MRGCSRGSRERAVPLALALGIGAVAWYRYLVFREDRADVPEEPEPVSREVILVSSNGNELATRLTAQAGVTVRTMRSSSTPRRVESVEELLATVAVETHQRLIVIDDEAAGYEVVALDG